MAAWIAAGTAVAQQEPPNIVVLLADDLGNGDVACYGAADVRTPAIDSLAACGLRLTNYYAPAPICAPSRGATLTGRYPSRAGMSAEKNVPSDVNSPGMSGREVTFAELARTRGYATAVLGKWHLGSTVDDRPNAQGFDLFVGHHASCVDGFSHMYYASEPWHHDLFRNTQEIFADGRYLTELVTDEAIGFMKANREKPFLLYVAYNVPHYPMTAQAKFMAQYANLPEPRRTQVAMVAGMDESVGRITAALDELQLREKTLVIFTSDNGAPGTSLRGEGGGRNTPYRSFKRSVFDGGGHVPAIAAWPGTLPAGQDRGQLAVGMDIFTTVAEAIGAKLPADRTIDGRSWLGFLKDQGKPGHERLFFEWAGQAGVREGRWKLMLNAIDQVSGGKATRVPPDDAVFLADVQADPGERTNVRDAHPEVAQRLTRLHEQWKASIAADPTASKPPATMPAGRE